MSNFTVLRMQKLKSIIAVRRSMKHAFREQETPNADPARLSENTHFFAQNVAESMQNFKKKLPEKIRKNGVLAVEFLITASPNALDSKTDEEISAYFSDALRYLQDKHGAENVVYAGIHRDETTPHMYAYIVPLDERGKLNCHKFYGAKNALSDLQTDFFEQVGHKHGLDRGIKGSKAKHTKIRDYYARVNAVEDLQIEPDADIEFPSPTLVDKAKTYDYGYKVAESVTAQLTKQYESQLKAAAIKYQNKLHEKDLQVSWSRNYGTRKGWENDELIAKNRALTEKLSDFESTKLQLNGAQATISQLESTTKLFTKDEILWAQNRNEKKVKEAKEAEERQEQEKARARQKAAAERAIEQAEQARIQEERQQAAAAKLRAENEAKWAAEAAKEAEKLAKSEYIALRNAWMDKNWDAVFEFEHAKNPTLLKRDEKTDEFIMSWAQRLELIKAQIKEWEALELQPEPEPEPQPEPEPEPEPKPRDDYDSPSPF